MSKITPQQIQLAKQYFRDGYSIPECCEMAGMSKASFNKHCRDVVTEYVSQDVLRTSLSDLSLSELESYLEYEFSQCSDDIAIRDLFYEIRNDTSLNGDQLVLLREIYERCSLSAVKGLAYKQIIAKYRDRHKCYMPIARDANSWDEMRLYEHLCYWLYKSRNQCGSKQALAYVNTLDLEQRKLFVNS